MSGHTLPEPPKPPEICPYCDGAIMEPGMKVQQVAQTMMICWCKYANPETRMLRKLLDGMSNIWKGIKGIEEEIQKLRKEEIMADQDIANLVAAVTQETAVDQSAITLINGIAAQIAAAVAAAGSLSAADRASLEAAVTNITNNASALSAAVTANTPASTTTPAAKPVVPQTTQSPGESSS